MKLKYTLVFTIISFFITIAGFAQQYSDQEIGLNVERITASLKKRGNTSEEINLQVSLLRRMYTNQYTAIKKNENIVLKSQQSIKTSSNKSLAIDISPTEKAALKALYDSTDGANWNNNQGWDFDTAVTSWDGTNGWCGISVTNGTVTGISLSENNLNGVLPIEIGNFSNLQYLFLGTNQLTGSIPKEIEKLSKLTNFSLGDNQLNGSIPVEVCNLTNVKALFLENNNLTGVVPSQINKLTKLEYFNLSNNQLTGSIPSEIGDLYYNLKEIYFHKNHLSGIIPNQIFNLYNLSVLNLSDNQFNGNIPNDVGKLKNISLLYFDKNQLTGTIPPILGNLSELIHLGLGSNQLTSGIPVELGKLTRIQWLNLSFNQLKGNIPVEIGGMPYIYTLLLNNNQFEGLIPHEMTQLSLLGNLNFSNNKFRFVDFASDFEAYKAINPWEFNYANQAKIDIKETINANAGSLVTLTMCTDNRYTIDDTFQWYKGQFPDGLLINGANSRQYIISNLLPSDQGTYYCLSSHPQITNLTNPNQNLVLEREPITLNITGCTPVTGTLNPTTQNTFTNTDINFSFATAATGLTYEWTFQNASNSTTFTTSSAIYSYAAPGNYNVTLIVTDSNGCKTTFTKIMTVVAKPVCVAIVGEIKTSSEKVTPNQNVTFSFETAATNFIYNWIFYNQAFVEIGRAATSTASRSYNLPGDYLVALELTDQNNCKTYKGFTVKVAAECPSIVGTIKLDTENPFLYTYANFTFETTATNLTYTWTVKIPENSTTQYNYAASGNPFQLYLQYGAGDYKIMLEAKDANGCVTKFEKIFTAKFDCNTVSRNGSILNTNKQSYDNPLVLLNAPNPFTFYPPVDESETGIWTITNLNGDVISTAATAEFILTPTVSGDYKINYKITNSSGCESNFSNTIKVVDICEYTDEERYGSINFVNEYSSGAAFIDINQTKTLRFGFYAESIKTYNYQWKVYDPNNVLVDSGNQKTFPLTLTTPGFHRVTVAITDPETGCQSEFSKSIGTVISNSCTTTNPKSLIVENLYLDLIKNLIARSMMGETDEQINASPANVQFTALTPYITNGVKDKIYNYKSVRDENENEETNSLRSIDFSFSPDRVSDIRVYFKWGMYYNPEYDTYEDLLDIIGAKIYFSMSQYTSPNEPLISCSGTNGDKIKGNNQVKPVLGDCIAETIAQYIDFCPAEDCKPIIGVLKSTDTSGILTKSKIKAKPVSKK